MSKHNPPAWQIQGVFTPGADGSGVDDKVNTRLNTNPELMNLQRDIKESDSKQASQEVVDDFFSDSEDKSFKVVGRDKENKANMGIKGTVVIDGTGKSDGQNAAAVDRALQTTHPDPDE